MRTIVKVSRYLEVGKMKTQKQRLESTCREIIERAGAIWVGIQEVPHTIPCPTLVMFNCPITNTTRSIAVKELSVSAVRIELNQIREKGVKILEVDKK